MLSGLLGLSFTSQLLEIIEHHKCDTYQVSDQAVKLTGRKRPVQP
jgi:hypothetical protein